MSSLVSAGGAGTRGETWVVRGLLGIVIAGDLVDVGVLHLAVVDGGGAFVALHAAVGVVAFQVVADLVAGFADLVHDLPAGALVSGHQLVVAALVGLELRPEQVPGVPVG